MLALPMFMSSCVDHEPPFSNERVEELKNPFDFSTDAKVCINVALGQKAAKEVICFYPSKIDPVTVHTRNDMLCSCFLDEDGCIVSNVSVPAHINKLYAYFPLNPDLGTMEIPISGNFANVNQLGDTRKPESELQFFDLEGMFTLTNRSNYGKFYCLGEWHPTNDINDPCRYGQVNDVNQLETKHTIIADYADELYKLHTAHVKDMIKKGEIESVDENTVNISITEHPDVEVIAPNGTKYTKHYVGSELFLVFLGQNATFCNPFGYYVYPTDSKPETVAEGNAIDRYLVFPNISVADKKPFILSQRQQEGENVGRSIFSGDAPVEVGERLQLLYPNPDNGGKPSRVFPVGTTIGFWLQPEGFDCGWKIENSTCTGLDFNKECKLSFTQIKSYVTAMKLVVNQRFINSNLAMTDESIRRTAGGYSRYAYTDAELYGEKFRIYGIEDSNVDNTLNDNTFVIEQTEVYEYIEKPDYFEEDWHIVATYAYEDIWPNGGDFDLNDIVIEHWQQKVFKSNNELISVNDRFDIVSPDNSASQHNGFFVNFAPGEQGLNLTIDDRSDGIFEAETNSAIIFTDQHQQYAEGHTSITMKRDFTGTGRKVTDPLPINPFLIANTDKNMGQGRSEIHLPTRSITSLGMDAGQEGDLDKNYYANRFISEGHRYPFAIALTSIGNWHPADNDICIDQIFLHYREWADTRAAVYRDWYYNRHGYDVRY